MAIWQFELAIIPTPPDDALQAPEDGSSDIVGIERSSWVNTPASSLIIPFFDAAFEDGVRSWGAGHRSYGAEQGNRIDVCHEGDAVTSVRVRLDAWGSSMTFVRWLVRFLNDADCVLVDGDGCIIAPTLSAVRGALENSDEAALWRTSRFAGACARAS